MVCPKFVEVNGSLEPDSYEIQEGDSIETRNFYTVAQIAEFMDVEIDPDSEILVNNREAGMETLVYENFSIDWTPLSFGFSPLGLRRRVRIGIMQQRGLQIPRKYRGKK